MSADEATTVGEDEIQSAQSGMFESVMENEPEKKTQDQPNATEQADRERDESGRFIAKNGTDAAGEEPQQTETDDQPEPRQTRGNIPSGRLKEEADKRRAAEAEASELRTRLALIEQRVLNQQPMPQQPQAVVTKKELPDPLLDPAAYHAAVREEIMTDLKVERFNDSMEAAAEQHGELFQKAFVEANRLIQSGDQVVRTMLMNARNPGKKLIDWYKDKEAVREVGGDPNAWFEKRLESWLNDPANQAKAIERIKNGSSNGQQQQRPQNKVTLPPSLNNAANAASRDADEEDLNDPSTQSGIFASVLSR